MSAVVDRGLQTGMAYDTLRREFLAALARSPETTVQTPGLNQAEATVAFLVYDNFAGTNGDAALHELLSIVALNARGIDTQLRSAAWMAAQAHEFADWHCDDLVRLDMESGG